jgi:hypothetical protein
MCLTAQAAAPTAVTPVNAGQAVAMVHAGLDWLAAADPTALTTAEQAQCLRGLEQAAGKQIVARSHVLGAFHAGSGYQDDGHGSAKSWLRGQTQVTGNAAGGAIGWMRRLAAHPAVRDALAGGAVSESWARQICAWTDPLPGHARGDADVVMLGAAAGGASLRDLGGLAEQIRAGCAGPDIDGRDDGFAGRRVWLETTFGGAGVVHGDLTPHCAAALSAVLEALGKRAGPEDLRTKGQRMHDAVDEACRRLIAAGCLPAQAGQPTHIQLHMTLDQLRGLPGASGLEAAWAGAVAGPGDDCNATLIPVVTGHIDFEALDRLTAIVVRGLLATQPDSTSHPGADHPGVGPPPPPATRTGGAPPTPAAAAGGGAERSAHEARAVRAVRAARQIVLAAAADLLSGPAGLASYLRTGIADELAASISQPLDVGTAVEIIPAHLRRAVAVRDRHCRFPGCDQPVAACQPHHIIPRSQGGPTCLTNLLLLCTFHHLIAIHRWGWRIVLHSDGTVTATSPDGGKTLHSHGPPSAHAA